MFGHRGLSFCSGPRFLCTAIHCPALACLPPLLCSTSGKLLLLGVQVVARLMHLTPKSNSARRACIQHSGPRVPFCWSPESAWAKEPWVAWQGGRGFAEMDVSFLWGLNISSCQTPKASTHETQQPTCCSSKPPLRQPLANIAFPVRILEGQRAELGLGAKHGRVTCHP